MATARITYIGHASFRFESEQGTVIYYDPWLDESPVATMRRDDVDRADIVIASHGHNDHIRDAFEVCERTGATFVGNYESCLAAQAHGLAIGDRAVALNPGGSTTIGDARITLVQAFHAAGSMSPNLALGAAPDDMYFRPDGGACGVVIAFDSGITIYNTSDTALFSDMQLISQTYGPQIAILPVGGKFTMGVREGARAASLIRPDVVIPCHYGDAVGQPADIDEFANAVEFLTPTTRVAVMQPGQALEYTSSSYAVSG
jgi:L-ascorbate metabolism protein UlaG (beta-lactamase superfamily)